MTYTAVANVSATTSATPKDATFVAFPDQACSALLFDNVGRQDIQYQRNGAGDYITVLAGTSRLVAGITNANQIAIRRDDHANLNTTLTSTVIAQALTGGVDVGTATALSKSVPSGGTYAVFASAACVCMELINTSGKDIKYRLNGAGSACVVPRNTSVMIYGITNANQVGILPNNNVAGTIRDPQAEVFTVGVSEPLYRFRRATFLNEQARVELGDLQNPQGFPEHAFLALAQINEKKTGLKRKPGKRPLAQFLTAATVQCSNPGTLADVTTPETVFGQSAVEYTQASTAQVKIAPAAALGTAVNASGGGSIHVMFAFPGGTPNFATASAWSSMEVRLYSSGTPASPAAAYHVAVLNSGWSGLGVPVSQEAGPALANSFSIPVSRFTTVGGGATLSALTYAAFYITGGSAGNGAKMRPLEIAYVPNLRSKAAVIFSFDDLHPGSMIHALPILARYGYPAMICVDTFVKTAAAQGTSVLSANDLISLHNHHGWQITHQQYDNSSNSVTSAEQHMLTATKALMGLMALGFTGLQDTSNGHTSLVIAPNVRRLFRTNMLFVNGNAGAVPSFPETYPFGEPYRIQRMNMSTFTAGTFYDRWKDYVDQAVACKGVAIFGAHNEFNTGGSAEYLTALESLCAYLRTLEEAGTCEVLTLDGLIRSTPY